MKFKTVLDYYALQNLLTVATCIAKASEVCAIYLTESTFELRKKPEVDSEVEIYGSLKVDGFQEV